MSKDPIVLGQRAEIMLMESEHRKLLKALEDELPTIRESILISDYIPHMGKADFPWAAWINGVSHMAANAVNILNDKGEVVGQVPPLCITDGLQSRNLGVSRGLTDLIADASDHANRTPHIAQKVLFGLVNKHIPQAGDSKTLAQLWSDFFTRYGVKSDAMPAMGVVAQAKVTAKPIHLIYDEGELL